MLTAGRCQILLLEEHKAHSRTITEVRKLLRLRVHTVFCQHTNATVPSKASITSGLEEKVFKSHSRKPTGDEALHPAVVQWDSC